MAEQQAWLYARIMYAYKQKSTLKDLDKATVVQSTALIDHENRWLSIDYEIYYRFELVLYIIIE